MKMLLGLKLKLSVNNQDKPTPFFSVAARFSPQCLPVEAVRNETLLTFFIAGLSNPTVRWETRKMKSRSADAALQAAVESHYFLEIDSLKLQNSGVNSISTETPLDHFTELLRSLPTEIQNAGAQSSRTDRNIWQNMRRDRSDSQNSNRYRSLLPVSRRHNNLSNFRIAKKTQRPEHRLEQRQSAE